MTLPAGKQIGRYELIKLIGSGGIASVYQAFDPLFNRSVAIKLMHTPFLVQEEYRRRFLREAQATARLRHLGIVEILDYGETADHQLYIVMEFVQGPNLEQLLTEWREARRQVPLSEAVRFMRQLAEAVAIANENGVLHRDLKPANILLKPRQPAYQSELLTYDPLVTDFGLARLEGGADVTHPGVPIGGTPAYMAPEQLGNEPLDERGDVYSLGVIFYELVTGQLPFHLKTLQDALRQHALNSLPLRAPKELRPDLPDALNGLISQAINPVQSHRLPSARVLAQALSNSATNIQTSSVVFDPMLHDATVPDLTVPGIRVPDASVHDPDMTIPAISIRDHTTPQRAAPREAVPAKPTGKTEKVRAVGMDPNLTLGVDPALTLVSPQPAKRNVAAIALTTMLVVIAAALIWYFVTKPQGANTLPDSLATPDTSRVEESGSPTVTLTGTAEASDNPLLPGSALSQTVAAPLATLTDTVSSTVSSEADAVVAPNQQITATVIGADTSHPTQLWIDGDPTDWQVLRALSKSQMTTLESIYANEGSGGCQARDPGSATVDLGAQVQFAYDAANFYVSFLVEDDSFVVNAEPSQYAQGDATQLLLKMKMAGESTSAPSREDEFQLDFLPGVDQVGDRPAVAVRTLATPADVRPYSEGSVAASVMGDGYFLEAALPWSTFATSSPQSGQTLGVVANVSDNDTATTQQQECLLSVVANYNRESPESWAALRLE